ncbi:hypothetical protein [Desulfosporosinus nitroreducens]|uniref:Uncharacterized protein n=1 Tax=Desulfosporosinus nitroreducens TaxID=2018668 RepID=A0ABT8QK44_9FIRM|nr:hypothetical protein [Desulfosporosinus nitroreducens]MDO0821630.1 hypothetical protein [Desulfosporosinus nitroreducens]
MPKPDLCRTALGHTTQSKLTVQALGFGERGSRQMSRPWLTDGSVHPTAMDGLVSL